MKPTAVITLVRIDSEEDGKYYTVHMGSVPLCPQRDTWAEVAPVAHQALSRCLAERRPVVIKLWDGAQLSDLSEIPASL